MKVDELKTILCRLEPGMVLTVPDAWIDKNIAGSPLARTRLIEDVARQLGCSCVQEMDRARFEKLDYPRTG